MEACIKLKHRYVMVVASSVGFPGVSSWGLREGVLITLFSLFNEKAHKKKYKQVHSDLLACLRLRSCFFFCLSLSEVLNKVTRVLIFFR